MSRLQPSGVPRPWTLPLIIAAIVIPLAGGFLLLGPQGMVFAAILVALSLVFAVSRPRRHRPIEVAPPIGDLRHVLIVALEPIEGSALAGRVVSHARSRDDERRVEVLLLAPALNPAHRRWATDVGPARADASRLVEISVAGLSESGVDAEGVIGDSNPMLAIEDALRDFPADVVVLVADRDACKRLASELDARLDRPVSKVVVEGD